MFTSPGFWTLVVGGIATTLSLGAGWGSSSLTAEKARHAATAAAIMNQRGAQAVGLLSYDGTRWRILARVPLQSGARAIGWRPTGNALAVTTAGGNLSNELRLIDLTHQTAKVLARAKGRDPAAFFGTVAWSPSGRSLAVTRSAGLYRGEIDLINAATGSITRRFRKNARYDSSVSWAPDEASLYFTQQLEGKAPMLRRLILRNGKVVFVPGQAHGFDPTTRRDGALAVTTPSGIVIVSRGESRKVRATRGGDRFPKWSRDGTVLYIERPAESCPRFGNPDICSHVIAVSARGNASRVLPTLARNPAAR